MPIVPFSQRPMQPAIPKSMMPDETHLDMAAAQLIASDMLAQAPPMDKSSHNATSEKLDRELGATEDAIDTSHAEIKSGDEWNRAVLHNGKLIDPTKLSPRELKATGIKY